jgi:hypothetical protein
MVRDRRKVAGGAEFFNQLPRGRNFIAFFLDFFMSFSQKKASFLELNSPGAYACVKIPTAMSV